MTQLSLYNGVKDKHGYTVTVDYAIQRIKTGAKGLDETTRMLNVLYQTEPERYRTEKEKLPAATFSGTFPQGKRSGNALIQHTGLIPLDIDNDIDLGTVMADLAQNPHVFFAFVTPSGEGAKPLIPVYPIPTTAAEHRAAFNAVLEVFSEYAEQDPINLPKQREPNRLTFLAYDPRPIHNPSAWQNPITWDLDDVEPEPDTSTELQPFEIDTSVDKYLSKHGITFSETSVTKQQPDSSIQEVKVQASPYFPKALCPTEHKSNNKAVTFFQNNDGSITGFCNGCKSRWYLQQPKRRQAKLTRDTSTFDEAHTETLQENRSHRDKATDTFLTTDGSEKLHIQLVSDSTGAGKSHTGFAKAIQHSKRTLCNPPHTELAQQAVDLAYELGYKNPCHLEGREHNWESSGIESIPVEDRTADLFSRNNCIMVDEVKQYTDKRLAPRTYCELKCKHREDCLHLAQYEGLGQRDFIASCTPNLLFDLNLRGYLLSIVNATDEPNEQDLAIDAILGTQSESTHTFDYAILDDYGINALYTDVTFSESEFKALKKAWRGTPTGAFAKKVLKAFEKKKPHKIVKALRHAFESTTEHHDVIAKQLTQHARIGVIEPTEQSKVSKETQRLLSEKHVLYTDGGKQFIPVNYKAYTELTDKGVPTIHPQHLQTEQIGEQVCIPHPPTQALVADVPLMDLTPLWQKGATPIDLIRIFLASIGNDKNAPISRGFLPGDPPDAVLTFSLPPQAPVGILPHITMLSATTPPEDTQRTFDGQDIVFSVHIGGNLEWASGVNVYQFTGARLTASSVFDYPRSADGKRKIQETPLGLTPTAEKRLAKLNEWAKATTGKTAFISYKEFTEEFREAVNGFDIVTHFDKVAGLNFDGLKFLVVFGYPKVKHEVVMEHARKQYAGDIDTLPTGDYEALTAEVTETKNGITSTERRYTDPRLEKIRHQLATEKLQQAVGRIRLPVWTDTQTIIITSAPLTGITERCNLFSSAALNLAESPNELPNAMKRIQDAESTGDVQAIMGTKQIGKSQAYALTQDTRKQVKAEQDAERDAEIMRLLQSDENISLREIERLLKQSGFKRADRKYITTIVNEYKVGINSSLQLVYTNWSSEKIPTPNPRGSAPLLREPHPLRDTPEFDNIIRNFASQSCIRFCLSDRRMHTAKEIASRTFISEQLIENVLKDWYEKVLVSPGIGESYWMTAKDSEKCKGHIEKARAAALQQFLDDKGSTYNGTFQRKAETP